MAENSKIEWCDHTFNPWEGCTKVSPGCANCYAEARNHRFSGGNWGKGKLRRRTSAENWRMPVKWNRDAGRRFDSWNTFRDAIGTNDAAMVASGHEPFVRPRVFCASLADWLDDEVPIEWLADLLKWIHDTPNLDWLLLTKRPENWERRLRQICGSLQTGERDHTKDAAWQFCDRWLPWNGYHRFDPPHNVWIGVSVEDQKRADERIPELLKIPARVRFLSVEPMLGPIDFASHLDLDDCNGIPRDYPFHWVIYGGESGPNARPCNVEWIRDGIAQCREAGVRVFVKQLGARACQDLSSVIPEADITDPEEDPGSIAAWEYHRHTAPMHLKDPKGGDMAEWPEQLRVRQFPWR